ncbi:hypothetical protein CTEN210_00387 [Chaetoceros tenuissimus]|uniref:RING-type domain-containing protein n=1 Tax=Chaetoceros tenuissimus TaxID=426638 RepID=A0AAD3CDQ5_9STRA|nr:hypothetical protein CTEN210_00387 [Chaetoceros tenuissimus]
MTSRPQPISGSIGERIRVILGKDGDEWLLLLNKDNGERKWQTQNWSNIPFAVAKQLNNCIKKDRKVTIVDFNGNGAWYINAEKHDGSGGHAWWGGTNASNEIKQLTNKACSKQVYFGTTDYNNDTDTYVLISGNNGYQQSCSLNQSLVDRMKSCNNRGGTIHFIRLFHDNEYVVKDDNGREWIVDGPLDDELRNTSGEVHDVAKARDGSWIVIRDNRFIASQGVSNELRNTLTEFYNEQRRYNSERDAEIRQYDAEQSRLAQEARERAQQEARLQREREERERREREEKEAEEARKRAIEAEKARKEAAEKEKLKRATLLEEALIKRVTDEANDIVDAERNIEKRKQSLKQSLEMIPESARPKISTECENLSKNVCVVCQHEDASMVIVPCGHACLCGECSMSVINNSKQCPLCRAAIREIIRIYFGNK